MCPNTPYTRSCLGTDEITVGDDAFSADREIDTAEAKPLLTPSAVEQAVAQGGAALETLLREKAALGTDGSLPPNSFVYKEDPRFHMLMAQYRSFAEVSVC